MEAQSQTVKTTSRNAHAIEVLRRLNDLGAINLEVMISKADQIKAISNGGGSTVSEENPEDKMCYPFFVKFGPRLDVDIVSVASELRSLGFEVKKLATK